MSKERQKHADRGWALDRLIEDAGYRQSKEADPGVREAFRILAAKLRAMSNKEWEKSKGRKR